NDPAAGGTAEMKPAGAQRCDTAALRLCQRVTPATTSTTGLDSGCSGGDSRLTIMITNHAIDVRAPTNPTQLYRAFPALVVKNQDVQAVRRRKNSAKNQAGSARRKWHRAWAARSRTPPTLAPCRMRVGGSAHPRVARVRAIAAAAASAACAHPACAANPVRWR